MFRVLILLVAFFLYAFAVPVLHVVDHEGHGHVRVKRFLFPSFGGSYYDCDPYYYGGYGSGYGGYYG
ncbi:hypothetical protein Y032_0065g3613 [Ancylostoma ceylanicum]|uniref:Uncharacterized protein n=1 Tax=Ancylostoma ceylanicum TaxID=53326 RepID=A0A016U1W1_9BILA|nr:hypothetical protein Y032_0065g3613 [Ancylostoma ceylanicum]